MPNKSNGTQTDTLTAEVKRLVAMSHTRPAAAAAELCALGDEAVSILRSLAQAGGRLRNRLRWYSIGVMALGYTMNLVFILLLPKGTRELYQYCGMGMALMGSLGMLLAMLVGKRATKLLASLDEMRDIGPLLDALAAHRFNGVVIETIRESLVRLLPRLHASDATSLLPRHISALNSEVDFCRAWKWGSPNEVLNALVVLKALEEVGDETSISSVERVLQTTKNSPGAGSGRSVFALFTGASGHRQAYLAASSEFRWRTPCASGTWEHGG